MIKVQGRLPKRVYLACSGGVDSMAVLNFLNKKHNVEVLHFNHGMPHDWHAEDFITTYCLENQIPCKVANLAGETCPKNRSVEDWWREKRYAFFDQYQDAPVITCHHLDDCVETWIWSSMNGKGRIIPYRRNNVIRPFRLNRKRNFEMWCNFNSTPWVDDITNTDTKYTRNYIRHQMMPHVLRVNPGIHKTVLKKMLKIEQSTV